MALRAYFKKASAVGDSAVLGQMAANRNYQLIAEGSGAVSVKVTVFGSMLETGPWVPVISFDATGTNVASDDGETNRMWRFSKATITEITGTGAVATLLVEG